MSKNSIEVAQAFEVIKKAMVDDNPSEGGSYAHSWHCNIAMACYDAMMHAASKTDKFFCHDDVHKIANDGASRFMELCFGVETTNDFTHGNSEDIDL